MSCLNLTHLNYKFSFLVFTDVYMNDVLAHPISVIIWQLFNLVIDSVCLSVPISQEQSTEGTIAVFKITGYAVLHCDIYSKMILLTWTANQRRFNFPFAFYLGKKKPKQQPNFNLLIFILVHEYGRMSLVW